MENRLNNQSRELSASQQNSKNAVVSGGASNSVALTRNGAQRQVAVKKSPVAARRIRVTNQKKKEKKPFPFATVLTTVAFTVLFLFMMLNYVELDRYNSEIASLKGEVTDLKKEEANLQVKLNKKDDLAYIEEYASGKLGMVKADELETYYVDIKAADRADIVKYDDGAESGLGVLLSGVGQTIMSFFGK